MVRLAETEAITFEGFTTLGARHVLSPQFAVSASDAIAHIQPVYVELRSEAGRTVCEGKLLLAALAVEEGESLEDRISLRQYIFSAADAGDEFVGELAGNAGDIAPHMVEVFVFVEELKTVLVGTAEVVHAVIAINTVDFLSEVRLIQEDGLGGFLAMGTYLQRPKLISA
jgi:hypothetical protein